MNHVSTINPSISIIRPLTLKRRFSLKIFWPLSFISILILLVFYIFQVNAFTKETYSIQDYEKKLSQTTGENEILKINFSKSNSLKNMESYLGMQEFEKVSQGQVRYIQILENQVAAKK